MLPTSTSLVTVRLPLSINTDEEDADGGMEIEIEPRFALAPLMYNPAKFAADCGAVAVGAVVKLEVR